MAAADRAALERKLPIRPHSAGSQVPSTRSPQLRQAQSAGQLRSSSPRAWESPRIFSPRPSSPRQRFFSPRQTPCRASSTPSSPELQHQRERLELSANYSERPALSPQPPWTVGNTRSCAHAVDYLPSERTPSQAQGGQQANSAPPAMILLRPAGSGTYGRNTRRPSAQSRRQLFESEQSADSRVSQANTWATNRRFFV